MRVIWSYKPQDSLRYWICGHSADQKRIWPICRVADGIGGAGAWGIMRLCRIAEHEHLILQMRTGEVVEDFDTSDLTV